MSNVACIIVNYNDSKRTLDLSKRICEYPSINQVVVVENNSTDDSLNYLASFEHPKYHVVKSSRNGGYGYGNNLGAKKAKELGAEYILIANPDVCFKDECVSHMLHEMKDHSMCAVVGAKEVKLGTYAWRYTSALDDVLSASVFLNKMLKKRYYKKEFFYGKDCVEVDIIPGSLLLVDLEKFFEVGGYDETIFLYEEEKVLYRRFCEKYVTIVDLQAEYEHHHVESHSYSVKSALVGKKRLLNSKYYFLKNYRKMSPLALCASKLFFRLTMFEMFIWILVRNIVRSK